MTHLSDLRIVFYHCMKYSTIYSTNKYEGLLSLKSKKGTVLFINVMKEEFSQVFQSRVSGCTPGVHREDICHGLIFLTIN